MININNLRHPPLEESSQKGSFQSEHPTSIVPSLSPSFLSKVLKNQIISDSSLMCLNSITLIETYFDHRPNQLVPYSTGPLLHSLPDIVLLFIIWSTRPQLNLVRSFQLRKCKLSQQGMEQCRPPTRKGGEN